MTSIRHSRRFVACYASVLHVKVCAKELVIGGRGGVVAESKGSCPDVWIYQFH